jgi:hypothetical protein
MGLPQDCGSSDMDETKVTMPFPAPTRQLAGEINGVKTDIMHMSFADKVMITITQNGRLSQWVCLDSKQFENWDSTHVYFRSPSRY